MPLLKPGKGDILWPQAVNPRVSTAGRRPMRREIIMGLSVFQAIGLAGDLTITGEREDVLLIRENHGKRLVSHINLKKALALPEPMIIQGKHMQENKFVIIN